MILSASESMASNYNGLDRRGIRMMVILEKVSLSASRSQPQQEMRTKQKKIPLRNFSRRGIAYQKENAKPEVMRVIRSSSVAWSVAGAGALVGVRPSRRYHRPLAVVHRTLQSRLEMPRVAIRIERQGHHPPVVPGCRHEILPVEVRVAAGILHVCFARPARHRSCDDRVECLA